MENKTASNVIYEEYLKMIKNKYPNLIDNWPVLSGYNIINGVFREYIIVIFKDTGISGVIASSVKQFNDYSIGSSYIDDTNIDTVRNKLRQDYGLERRDSIVILKQDCSNLSSELGKLLAYHEIIMGVVGMKIFLSHKGVDKQKVRDFKSTLELIGFDPWLDEDAMNAGIELERGIRKGFADSCAAIFFVTPSFLDENYLSSEINYAIFEKRKKKEKFAIITLVFEEDGTKGKVPELLESYVWKEPKNDLEAIREIIKAVPLQIGNIFYKI